MSRVAVTGGDRLDGERRVRRRRVASPILVAVQSRGMTMARLAEHAGLTLNGMRRIAFGEALPRLDTALRLADLLDADVEDLFPASK